MMDGPVVYVEKAKCPSCGKEVSGYLESSGDGQGTMACPSCGATIKRELPKKAIAQIPPPDYHSPSHPHVHVSHYPGLYIAPKLKPRFDLSDLLRVAYSPTKAFASLYLKTNLERSLAVVVIFSLLSAVASTLITADMAEVIGYDSWDTLLLVATWFLSWTVSLFTFLIFATAASVVAKGVFGGRGERGSTIALLGYAYPIYVLLTVVLLFIFDVGFEGLALTSSEDWTQEEVDQAISAGAVFMLVVLVGLPWLVWVSSKAVSVANDVSTGEGAISIVLASVVAGVVYLVAEMFVEFPLGLWF